MKDRFAITLTRQAKFKSRLRFHVVNLQVSHASFRNALIFNLGAAQLRSVKKKERIIQQQSFDNDPNSEPPAL